MRATETSSDEAAADYTVRLFEPGDRASYLDLYETVFGGGSETWFDWKYAENPYLDYVPTVVAVADGRVVGAKSGVAFRLRAGDRRTLAHQPADTMVHPDHRGRGLYSRMTEHMKEVFRERAPGVFFNFPNRKTLSGSLKHGWKIVGIVPTYYRVQNPAAFADVESTAVQDVLRLATPPVKSAFAIQRAVTPIPDDVSVVRRDTVPPATFARLYRQVVPDALHAERDGEFYEWRYDNPKWRYWTYLGSRDDVEVGVIVGRRTMNGTVTVTLTDVVPLLGESRQDPLVGILCRVCRDHADADVLAVGGRAIPRSVLVRFGFLPDTSLPLSAVSTPTVHVAYPSHSAPHWRVLGLDARKSRNWHLTFAEQDTY